MKNDARSARRYFTRFGWVSMVVALAIPLFMSMYASYAFQTLTGFCDEDWRWGFAPLVATCGDPSPLAATIGWTATLATVVTFALSACCCVAALVTARSFPARSAQRRDSVVGGVSIGAVIVIVVSIVLGDMDARLSANGVWIWIASTVGLLASAMLIVVGALIHMISRKGADRRVNIGPGV